MRRAAVASKTQQSKALKAVKELDAFPKVPDNFKETTASGGGISIVTFLVIIILVISEIRYYTNTSLKFDYVVDTDVDGKIKINIDMTVAMKCDFIGADVLDQTGQDAQMHGTLEMENTHWELSPRQRHYREITQHVNRYLRDEYHALQELMWLSGTHPSVKAGMPKREDSPEGENDACRVHGSLEVNKVAGNFHITAGKYYPQLQFGLGHAHLETFMGDRDYNFTHRIDHFSFGEKSGGIVNPLDGEELVTKQNYQLYQYFMKIVPTDVNTYTNRLNTYQYSVTERNRTISHSSGSHGVPGIFIKYDVFPFKIKIVEEHKPYSQFLVRLCGIIGGIFVVSGQDYQSSSRGDSDTGPGQHTEFKKPMLPSRGFSRGQRGRFGRGRTPDYRVHPENWTEYSLEDVDVSDSSNKQAAFSFLQERRSLNETDAKESAADLESKACSKGQIVFKRPSKTKSADNQDKAKDRQTKALSVDVDSQSDEEEGEEGKDCDLKKEDAKEKSQASDADLDVDRHNLKRKLDELEDNGDKTADIGSAEKQVEFKSRKTSKRQIRSRRDRDEDSD